jgi:hypothetical protein
MLPAALMSRDASPERSGSPTLAIWPSLTPNVPPTDAQRRHHLTPANDQISQARSPLSKRLQPSFKHCPKPTPSGVPP